MGYDPKNLNPLADEAIVAGGVYANLEVTSEEPTSHLRWRDGVLEQMTLVTTYTNGRASSISNKWEPVPTITGGSTG